MQIETIGKIECQECGGTGTAIKYMDKIIGEKLQEGCTAFNKHMYISNEFVLLFMCNNCGNLFLVNPTD